MQPAPRAKFARVLSIDGGGIRGIIPAAILVRLEEKLQKATGNPQARIADFFDLIAGTSTGGIMTCALLVTDPQSGRPKYSAPDVLDIYYNGGAKIFEKDLKHKLTSLAGFNDSKYSTSHISDLIQKKVGDAKLSELAKPCVVTAFDLQTSSAFFFKSHYAVKDKSNDFLVRDVALSTSAAPTFFDPYPAHSMLGQSYTMIDGGVVCNNPALSGLVEITRMHKITQREVVVLSLGTGFVTKSYTYSETKDWGELSWIRPLLNTIMINGVSQVVDYQLTEIYSGPAAQQYLRIQPNLEGTGANPEMDDASHKNRDALKEVGERTAQEFDQALDGFVQLLLATSF